MSLSDIEWLDSRQTKELLKQIDQKLMGYLFAALDAKNMEELAGYRFARQQVLGLREFVSRSAKPHKEPA